MGDKFLHINKTKDGSLIFPDELSGLYDTYIISFDKKIDMREVVRRLDDLYPNFTVEAGNKKATITEAMEDIDDGEL